MMFELDASGQSIACAVSREALEASGPGRSARPWQLREAFDRLRLHIEQIALNKFRASGAQGGPILVTSEDVNELNPAAPAAALREATG